MPRVVLIAKPGPASTGVGRYVGMLHDGLRTAGVEAIRVAPAVPPLPRGAYPALRRLGVDAQTFLTNFPVWARYPRADVYHVTSQNLASLLLLRPPKGKVVVTVHDIIPYMLRQDARLSSYRTVADRLFDRMAMAGLKRADRLIADSHYTRRCVTKYLEIGPEKVEVVHLGIDQDRFRPLPVPGTLRERYGLPPGRRFLIYVGSEDPRKNLDTLLRALAEVRGRLPDVELIKVGRAHFDHQRARLTRLANELEVRSAVHFLDDVPEDDLPLLYNLAEVCVLPSLYEGFGFPVVEAMACGTPVVYARAASLPELVGEAGLLFEPASSGGLAAAVVRLLEHRVAQETARAMGLARARGLGWGRTVDQTIGVYRAPCAAAGPARQG